MTNPTTDPALIHNSGMTKIERYKWTVKNVPGVLLEIDKNELHIDQSYQRVPSEPKIIGIAKQWSWIACGAIIVGERTDKKLFVIDGWHRVLAARRRADIDSLPCVIFETTAPTVEAQGFLDANTARKAITGIDKFHALIVTGSKAAALIKRLADNSARSITSSDNKTRSVRCVVLLMKLAEEDPTMLESMWPVFDELMPDTPFHNRIVGGLMYIEQRMPNGESLSKGRWRRRLAQIGGERLIEAAARANAFYAGGGANIWASGILREINRGLQHRLKIEGLPDDTARGKDGGGG